MATVPPPPPEPRLLATLGRDVKQVISDTRRAPHRAAIGRTLTDLETFYISPARRERLARAGLIRRWLMRLWWLFTGLLMKLTPARRVMLALGLFAFSGLQFRPSAGTTVSLDFQGLGTAMILLVLALELKDKLVAHDELEAGRAVQRALMPARAPAIVGWDVWMYTQSANEVGGDLVDHIAIDAAQTALVLADVAGKGLSAALLTSKLQATLRALVSECGSLTRLGACVNQIMYRDGVRGRFATLVWLGVPADGGDVRVLNAGHMAPLVVRPGGVEELPRGSMALGMVPSAAYEEQSVHLDPGDTLVVYSDGVSEMMNGALEFFGEERLRHLLVAQRGRDAEVIGSAIVSALAAFAADTPPHDDVSLIVLRRLGGS